MLYIFLGTDTFSRREALQKLKSDLDQDGMLTSNTLALDARQTTAGEVASACNALPFFGKHRLVIIEGLLQSSERPRGRLKKRLAPNPEDLEEMGNQPSPDEANDEYEGPWQALVKTVDEMPETTALVIIDDKASNASLFRVLGSKGKVQRFDSLNQKSVPAWIQRRAQARGLKIDARAAGLMADAVGTDTWMLANEIEKLVAYANGDIIREADVRALVSRIRELQGYLLADAVADNRPHQALKLLHELAAQVESLQPLLSTIEGRYRRLAVARELLDAGASDSEIGRRIAATGYPLQRVIEQAGRWPIDKLRDALTRIAQADADTKGGIYDERLSLELLVHDLTGASASRAA